MPGIRRRTLLIERVISAMPRAYQHVDVILVILVAA
jgi:hypothetical protein